jgi:hypothetical protein
MLIPIKRPKGCSQSLRPFLIFTATASPSLLSFLIEEYNREKLTLRSGESVILSPTAALGFTVHSTVTKHLKKEAVSPLE